MGIGIVGLVAAISFGFFSVGVLIGIVKKHKKEHNEQSNERSNHRNGVDKDQIQ